MAHQENCVRQPTPTGKRVAVALHRLASGNSYNSVGEMFGISRATVYKFSSIFIDEMLALKDAFIKLPRSEAATLKAIGTFKYNTMLPNVVGCIDGTHVEICKKQRAKFL